MPLHRHRLSNCREIGVSQQPARDAKHLALLRCRWVSNLSGARGTLRIARHAFVVPAQAGAACLRRPSRWTPAFAGVTAWQLIGAREASSPAQLRSCWVSNLSGSHGASPDACSSSRRKPGPRVFGRQVAGPRLSPGDGVATYRRSGSQLPCPTAQLLGVEPQWVAWRIARRVFVVPAQAGTPRLRPPSRWTPAFAGVAAWQRPWHAT
jgi:hypothetical protein